MGFFPVGGWERGWGETDAVAASGHLSKAHCVWIDRQEM